MDTVENFSGEDFNPADVELQDCPLCGGTGILEEENGWCFYVSCLDCGCHTAESSYKDKSERAESARKVAHLWNIGKVLPSNPGE